MLKVGGKLSYSTCSLNPIEDEAIVASALKQFPGCIELVEVSVPGFIFRQGLTQWKVMVDKLNRQEGESYFVEFDKYEDLNDQYKSKNIKETMFMAHYDENILKQLTKCLRVFPHDQDTSGFFITIIKKIKDFDDKSEVPQQEEAKVDQGLVQKGRW